MTEPTPERARIYDDAELAALQVIREVTAEAYGSGGRSAQVQEAITLFIGKYRNEEDGDGSAVLALTVALGRLAQNAWSVVLSKRLGHYPSRDEMLAELESVVLHKIEQHVAEEDGEQ